MNPASAARLRLRGAIAATAAAAVKAGSRAGQPGRRTQHAAEAGTAAAWPNVQASNENTQRSATAGKPLPARGTQQRTQVWAFSETGPVLYGRWGSRVGGVTIRQPIRYPVTKLVHISRGTRSAVHRLWIPPKSRHTEPHYARARARPPSTACIPAGQWAALAGGAASLGGGGGGGGGGGEGGMGGFVWRLPGRTRRRRRRRRRRRAGRGGGGAPPSDSAAAAG